MSVDYVVLIPARLSSSRLPQKALADIHGKPMVVRVAERALLSQAKRVVVATDHEAIVDACRQHNIEVILTSATHVSGTTRLAEAARLLGLAKNDCVVNVQGDEPLIDPQLIHAVAQQLDQCGGAMSTAAHRLLDFSDFMDPNCVKVVMDKYQHALYFSRAAIPWPRDLMRDGTAVIDEQLMVLRHIGIYGYRMNFLQEYETLDASPLELAESLEQLRVLWHGKKISVYISEHVPVAGVDTQEDLDRVRQMFVE